MMNLKLLPAEISKQVYDKYPVNKKERTCSSEKNMMDGKRIELVKRIMAAKKEKKEYKSG